MCVVLEKLTACMDRILSVQLFLEIFSGQILTEQHCEKIEDLNYIEIPRFDEKEIERIYLEQLNDEKFSCSLLERYEDSVFSSLFHTTVNNHGLYYNYIKFAKKLKLKIAQEWCEENNIKCTSKPLQRSYLDGQRVQQKSLKIFDEPPETWEWGNLSI